MNGTTATAGAMLRGAFDAVSRSILRGEHPTRRPLVAGTLGPTGDGRWKARLWIDGLRFDVGSTFDSKEAAERDLLLALAVHGHRRVARLDANPVHA